MTPQAQQTVKAGGDVLATSALVAWMAGALPIIATALTVIWFALQITEKVTGKTIPTLIRGVYARIAHKANP